MENSLQRLRKKDIIRYRVKIKEFLSKKFKALEGLDIYELIDGFAEQCVVVTRNNKICLVAYYFWLNEDAINEIKEKKALIASFETMLRIDGMVGNNIHFFGIAADNMGDILRELKHIMKTKKPDSVSWLNPAMDRFIFIKGK